MLRLLSLLVLLSTAAHAQTGALEDAFAGMAAQAEAEGGTIAVAPVVGMFSAEGEAPEHEVDLEAGKEYYLVLACEEGSGLDPDIFVYGPDDEVLVLGDDVGEGEAVQFTAEASGAHTLSVEVFGCEGECAYGFMIATR